MKSNTKRDRHIWVDEELDKKVRMKCAERDISLSVATEEAWKLWLET